MIGLLTADATKLCISKNFYTEGGQIRLQDKGGFISSDLTGECARIYMIQWDNTLVQKCMKLGLLFDMYSRYVDDMVIVMRAIGKGWKYDVRESKLVFDSNLEKFDNLSGTKRSARLIAQIADSINGNIQVMIDTSMRNSEGRLPVLNLKVWIQDNNVVHSFYKKNVKFLHYP